jgi:hypothetical protein
MTHLNKIVLLLKQKVMYFKMQKHLFQIVCFNLFIKPFLVLNFEGFSVHDRRKH